MTPRATDIRIPSPCPASWAAMTPASGGRHCAACAKTVVDFTEKSDSEILAYFQQTGPNRTCGRFRREQVNRPLLAGLPSPVARRWQVWLASLLVTALATQSCHTTIGEPVPTSHAAPQEITSDSVTVQAVPYSTHVSGRVVDQYTQQPVGNVRVQLQGSSFVVVTRVDGLFFFPAAATPGPATHQHPYVLYLLADGYPPCERVLDYASPPPNQRLEVVPANLPVPIALMGDVEVLR